MSTFLLLLAMAGQADDAVIASLQRASSLTHAAVIRRYPVNEQLDLVVALASSQPPTTWWTTHDRLGLFLQDKANHAYPLAIEAGPNNDCSTRIERITAQELVLSCTAEKWSTYENQKFVFDVRTRTLTKHYSYPTFRVVRIIDRQFLLSDDHQQLLIDTDFHVLSTISAPAVDTRPEPLDKKYPPLPQSDFETWRKARPDAYASGARLNPAEKNEEVGPHQLAGGRLWFGKTFYDSEGETGVGGFGYFDEATRSYKLYSPKEIQRWSVSAILVESECVWLALYRRGEYGNDAGGLLRWDRKTEQVRQFPMRSIAESIARFDDMLYLGGRGGITTLRGDQITSYFVDRTIDGHYHVVARN